MDDKAQPEALRYHEQLWEETWPDALNESFAATLVIEMMGAGLRCLVHCGLLVHPFFCLCASFDHGMYCCVIKLAMTKMPLLLQLCCRLLRFALCHCSERLAKFSCNERLQNCRIGGAAWGDKIYYEALIPVMNLLPLWGQESVMLQLAQQVTALLFCLGELYAEYSLPASMAQSERAGLFGDGLPIALHDKHMYVLLCSTPSS